MFPLPSGRGLGRGLILQFIFSFSNARFPYINNQSLAEPYVKEKPTYEMKPKLVPADAYFILGDNRNSSYDRHVWGYVPRSLIIGRATQIFDPFDRSRTF